MKKYRKSIVFVLVLLVITSLFCACGAAKESPAADMKSDLQQEYPDLGMRNVTVRERKTSKEDRTDTVYLTADVENELYKGTIDYVMEYKLYDQGWMLEACYRDWDGICDVKPVKGPDRTPLEYNEDLQPEEFVNESLDLENGEDLVYYQKIKENKLATVATVTEWKSYFDTERLSWSGFSKTGMEETSVVWDLEGIWRFQPKANVRSEDDYFEDCAIQISDVTSSTAHIKVYHNITGEVYLDADMTLDPDQFNKITTPEIVLFEGYWGKKMTITITTESVTVVSDNPNDMNHTYIKDSDS